MIAAPQRDRSLGNDAEVRWINSLSALMASLASLGASFSL